MSNDRTRRPADPWKNAQALFTPTAKAPPAAEKRPTIPGAKETVSLRIDREILEHFQSEGPGWQDRINETLRQAVNVSKDDGLTPDELNATNDG